MTLWNFRLEAAGKGLNNNESCLIRTKRKGFLLFSDI